MLCSYCSQHPLLLTSNGRHSAALQVRFLVEIDTNVWRGKHPLSASFSARAVKLWAPCIEISVRRFLRWAKLYIAPSFSVAHNRNSLLTLITNQPVLARCWLQLKERHTNDEAPEILHARPKWEYRSASFSRSYVRTESMASFVSCAQRLRGDTTHTSQFIESIQLWRTFLAA